MDNLITAFDVLLIIQMYMRLNPGAVFWGSAYTPIQGQLPRTLPGIVSYHCKAHAGLLLPAPLLVF